MQSPLSTLSVFVAASLMLGSCSNDSSSGPDLTVLATQLRVALSNAGVTVPDAPPSVSDELFDLGQALYFDKLISGNQDIACSTCHLATVASIDGRTLPLGVNGTGLGSARINGDMVPRNAPQVLDAHLMGSMFWDARVEFLPGGALRTPAGAQLTSTMTSVFQPGLELLAAQAMFPPTSRAEMRGAIGENELGDLADNDFTGIWQGIVDRVVAVPAYVTLLQAAYPGLQAVDVHMGHLGNAIAAFEARAFGVADSPLARFLQGDDGALTQPQLTGGLEYFGPAGCAACHRGPNFSDGLFHNVGMAQFGPGKGDGLSGTDDFGRERVTGDPNDRYRFRTPTLLNVELTAPYGHVGQFSTLASIVAHYRDTATSLNTYDIMDHVTEPGLAGTLEGNQVDVLANLSPLVSTPRSFNVQKVVTFLGALTADSARDLSSVMPPSVPSGLTID
ncbi:MAG: cytochrome c peroxidase [Planctomycetota bacterium]